MAMKMRDRKESVLSKLAWFKVKFKQLSSQIKCKHKNQVQVHKVYHIALGT